MLDIPQEAFDTLHQRGGKPPTQLYAEDKLLLINNIGLQYYWEYRTMEHLACEYDTVRENG